MDIGWGVYFDLLVLVLILVACVVYRLWRYLTYDRHERWYRRQIDRHEQHLAETAVRVPIRHAHEWDWPSR